MNSKKILSLSEEELKEWVDMINKHIEEDEEDEEEEIKK
jgi:hypothetical protein